MNTGDGRFWTITENDQVELSHGYVDTIHLTRNDLVDMLNAVDKGNMDCVWFSDFSWYRGEVDTDLLEKIVKLKAKGIL